MLAWSGVAQAGYLLAGVVVGTTLGLQATVFYLAVYLLMNVAAFAVVVARERASELGDDLRALRRPRPGRARALAWPMTIAMLSLAGFPATAGFIGKFYLIDAAVAGDYAWLGIVIVVGSMISLVLLPARDRRHVDGPVRDRAAHAAAAARQARSAGWSPEADAEGPARGGRRGGAGRGRHDLLRDRARRRCSTWRATWARRSSRSALASRARRSRGGRARLRGARHHRPRQRARPVRAASSGARPT